MKEVKTMKDFEAAAKGYSYSGISDLSRNSDFEARRAEIKKAGYKTVIVHEQVSRYSRSSAGQRYRSLYIEKKYFIDQEVANIKRQLGYMDARREEALAKIQKEEDELKERLAAYELKLIELA